MITDEQRWQRFKKYWDEFRGDVFRYDEGRFLFSPYNPDEPVASGNNLEKFIDWLIRKESKNES